MVPVPFAFIGPDHPFFPTVQALREAIVRRMEAATDIALVHAELKAVAVPGGWRLDRAYWSAQQTRLTGRPFGFASETLSWSEKAGRFDWLTFPVDPYLATAAAVLERWTSEGAGGRVLRYVPLRRLTLSVDHPRHGSCIAKLKRRSRAATAYALIGRVAEAVAASGLPLSVSHPIAFEEEESLYFQTSLPGEDVADTIGAASVESFARLGALHADLHRLPTDGLPVIGNRAWMDQARLDLGLLGLYRPASLTRLSFLGDLLERTRPDDTPPTFCHGDLVCSQTLAGESAWSITDFDLCHAGDPCRDIAVFLASLSYDVPAFDGEGSAMLDSGEGAASIEAYLESYGRRLASPDPLRLSWHRTCASLYYLALMLKKDRLDEPAFRRLQDEALRHAQPLAGPTARLDR
ncbi:MAG: aminoglycoside phosphotransferase family protein [Burkholderiales bacterium]|nr:aminoglycoside phosphotransferase family protein [Burkholderiales bacterium]